MRRQLFLQGLLPAGLLGLIVFIFGAPITAMAAEVKVRISGIEGKALENVQDVTALPPGLIREGEVNQLLLNRFIREIPERVQNALKPFGYYHADAKVQIERDNEDYIISVAVAEGPPVIITGINVALKGAGAEENRLRRLVRAFPLEKGDVLRQDLYEEQKNQLQMRATGLGYLDADFAEHAVRIWTEENRAEIQLVLDTGPQYFFNGVTFSGAPEYPGWFLNRYLAFEPGDVFSYAKLGETQVNFRNSERFRDVFVTTRKESVEDLRVPVDVNLTSLPSQRLKIGAGYGTDTGPRFSLRYQDLNVFKRGHEFESELEVSQRLQGIVARYVLPNPKSFLSHTAFKAAYRREDVDTYTTKAISFDIDREKSFGVGTTGAVFLRILHEESDISGESTTAFLVMPGVRYIRQRYNNLIRPTKGYRVSGELRGTTQAFGSDQTFLQFVGDGNFVYPIASRYTLYARSRIGWTLQEDSLQDLPASLRFFAGGDQSVRGYAYQSLGPRNDEGDVIGGRNLFVGSVEVERAIRANWGVAAFFDAGNAFNDASAIRLYYGAGIGVRYYSPVGPLKLDVARPLSRDTPVVRLHLTIGFST